MNVTYVFYIMDIFHMQTYHFRWIRKYGTVIRYYFFFGGERVLVANPKAMKRIFVTNSKNYIKPPDRLK